MVVERTVLPLCACVTGGSCYTAGNIGSKVRCGIAERLPKIFRPGIGRSSAQNLDRRLSIENCAHPEGLIIGASLIKHWE